MTRVKGRNREQLNEHHIFTPQYFVRMLARCFLPPKIVEMAGGDVPLCSHLQDMYNWPKKDKKSCNQKEECTFYCCYSDLKGNSCSIFLHVFLSSLPSWNEKMKGHVPWRPSPSAHFSWRATHFYY